MSGNEAGASEHRSKLPFRIRGPRDFYGGLAMLGLALLAFWASSDLPGQEGFAFGPGTTPRLFATLLLVVSVLIVINGLLSDGPPVEAMAVRGPAFVITAILFFAVTIRGFDFWSIRIPGLGLIPATYLAFMISIRGSSEMRWIESLIAAAGMTVFCVGLFAYLLQLPFPLWPGD